MYQSWYWPSEEISRQSITHSYKQPARIFTDFQIKYEWYKPSEYYNFTYEHTRLSAEENLCFLVAPLWGFSLLHSYLQICKQASIIKR